MLLPVLLLSLSLGGTAGVNSTAPSALDAARELFEARRYGEAQQSFETLLSAYPDHPEILIYLGKLAAKRHDREAAVGYLSRAVELAPENAEIQFEYAAACGFYASTLGATFKALRYARRASAGLRQAIELEPNNLDFRQGYLDFCLEAPGLAGGGIHRAREQAVEIAARDPVKGAFAEAVIHRASNDHAAALATLAGLIETAPENYFALFNFGRCAAESGLRLEEGLAFLQQCLALPEPGRGPAHAQVWWNIATIQKQRGDRAAAIAALEEAVALAPNDSRISHDLENYLQEE